MISRTLIIGASAAYHGTLEFMGPFPITQINDNGTVRFQKEIINDATNIRLIKPFFN